MNKNYKFSNTTINNKIDALTFSLKWKILQILRKIKQEFLETLPCWLFSNQLENLKPENNLDFNDELREKAINILGYAVSATEKLFIENDDSILNNSCKTEIRFTNSVITQTLGIIQSNSTINNVGAFTHDNNLRILSNINQIFENIQTQVVARGLLYWVELKLSLNLVIEIIELEEIKK